MKHRAQSHRTTRERKGIPGQFESEAKRKKTSKQRGDSYFFLVVAIGKMKERGHIKDGRGRKGSYTKKRHYGG